ncbi:MAG TPA: c-type cytochrome [Terracidiphilus sp.]|nr:c-type cytochrome [Terracidiphilus sp.]
MRLLLKLKMFPGTAVAAAAAGLLCGCVFLIPMRAVLAARAGQSASAAAPAVSAGAAVYDRDCSICHGKNREGIPSVIPPLTGLAHHMTDNQIAQLIHDGNKTMPPVPTVTKDELPALLAFLHTEPAAPAASEVPVTLDARRGLELSPEAAAGGALFQQNCAFCHGRDAMGGETGPDLTRSKLVLGDKDGSQIAKMVRQGKTDGNKKMPAFNFSAPEIAGLVAFIHARIEAANSMKGGRRGVDVSDLQTGNVELGKKYFNGAGGCAKCHSPTGDLAGIASRLEGLQLEERMLYPENAKSTVTVTLPSGKKISGTLAYRDEFTIGLKDSHGVYRSWTTDSVKYTIDSPVEAHVELFSRYTDDDIHNLMAYIQTLH